MEIKIITGRPGSGKTSHVHELIQKDLVNKVLYWNLEEVECRYMKKKFPDVYSSSNVILHSERLLDGFLTKCKSDYFATVVIDYIELINSKTDFISEIKNIKTLYILSQERIDGMHFGYPNAHIIKLPDRIVLSFADNEKDQTGHRIRKIAFDKIEGERNGA